jgi:hypothetical protein
MLLAFKDEPDQEMQHERIGISTLCVIVPSPA